MYIYTKAYLFEIEQQIIKQCICWLLAEVTCPIPALCRVLPFDKQRPSGLCAAAFKPVLRHALRSRQSCRPLQLARASMSKAQ